MAEPTAGAKWAIAELDDLRQNAEYRASHLVGIGALIADLQDGTPIRLAMCRPPAAQHPERMAILQAALAADAQAAVNRDVFASAGTRFAEIWTAIRDLDGRTLGLRGIR